MIDEIKEALQKIGIHSWASGDGYHLHITSNKINTSVLAAHLYDLGYTDDDFGVVMLQKPYPSVIIKKQDA